MVRGADDPETRAADSLYLWDLDLYLSRISAVTRPECRVVSLDACFNGSFHRDSSIANAYIFSPGRTVAVLANSVNVLQDKWVDRYVGLTGLGMSVGNLAKYAPYLEQHLIGDPTFRFASADKRIDVDELLRQDSPATWKRLLSDNRYPRPASTGRRKALPPRRPPRRRTCCASSAKATATSCACRRSSTSRRCDDNFHRSHRTRHVRQL